jgi:hypothetical protein
MKTLLTSLLLLCAANVFSQDNTFYYVSLGQLFVPTKDLHGGKADPSSMVRSKDFVVITLYMDTRTASISYLNSVEKNMSLKMAKTTQATSDSDAFDFKIIDNGTYRTLHFIGGSEKKLISLEFLNGDQQIFGDTYQVERDDYMVILTQKTNLVFSSSSRMEYTAKDLTTAYRTNDISKLDKNSRFVEDAIISIDRESKIIKVTSKKNPGKDRSLHYTNLTFGVVDGYQIFGFNGIDDPKVKKVILSLKSGAFSIELKTGINIIYDVKSL